MENSDIRKQFKSKERISKHGEVFTDEKEVKSMCDLFDHECERVDSRFFEPALHELGGVRDKNNPGYVYKMFEELEVNQLIEWSKVDETFTIVLKENKKTKLYTFLFGKNNML